MLYRLLLLGIIGHLVKADSCSTSDTVALTETCDCTVMITGDDCYVRFFLSFLLLFLDRVSILTFFFILSIVLFPFYLPAAAAVTFFIKLASTILMASIHSRDNTV